MGEKAFEQGRLTVTPMDGFASMDELIESGEESGKTHLGIIRWVGKKLEHLQAKIGDPRPEGFPYTKDSTAGYALMKRK
ncbi:MAG: hypothetical protein HKN47_26470 [Pirellulaceae bacterium]|nr:hypothetical protein [Pirellulaceae bacterium]